jgi:plastocyanin
MRQRLPVIVLALAALTFVAVGCGGDDDEDTATEPAVTEPAEEANGGGQATEVSMTEFAFGPADFTVAEGDTIELVNDGQLPHNLTLQGEDLASSDLDPGGTEELNVDLAPGEYEFVCTIGDHEQQGMVGTLTVE